MQLHISIICFLLIFACSMQGQNLQGIGRWEKKEIHYANQSLGTENNNNQINIDRSFTGIFISIYRVLISDADGDRCPFTPSCSGFFVEAVHRTNFAEGILLFMDRFTRDANPVNRKENYRFDSKQGRFFDPVEKYIIDKPF